MKNNLVTIAALAFSLTSFAATNTGKPKTDAEIVNMLMTSNTEEINLSTLGKQKAKNEKVKAFADKMYKAHSNNNERAMSLQKAEDIKLTETKPSMNKKVEVESSIEKLKTKQGMEFDKAFMETQVTEHQKSLDEMQNDLLPNAKNQKLKAMLQNTKTHIEEHLKEAKQIQSSMQ